ncbi:MAG: twin-arginine translocase TatA/TatE family subunit [Chloroflexia bacterium]|nr:twin-arginine translocase TatA/TatE family subunit [Chloroflexia bacterium]
MNIFGIGGLEIPIIAIAALLIFGPGKLPEVMGQAGKLVRDFRRMSAELTGEFEKTIAEAKDIGSSIQSEVGGMSKEVNSVADSVRKDLGIKGTSARKPGITSKSSAAASRSTAPATAKTTSKAGGKAATTTSKSTATKVAASKPAATPTAGTTATPASTTTKTTTKPAAVAKKPEIPVASREDPAAGISLFEPVAIERSRRSRTATPSAIGDRTPRGLAPDPEPTTPSAVTAPAPERAATAVDDPLARARQRRRTAGYAQRSA